MSIHLKSISLPRENVKKVAEPFEINREITIGISNIFIFNHSIILLISFQNFGWVPQLVDVYKIECSINRVFDALMANARCTQDSWSRWTINKSQQELLNSSEKGLKELFGLRSLLCILVSWFLRKDCGDIIHNIIVNPNKICFVETQVSIKIFVRIWLIHLVLLELIHMIQV